MPKVKEIGQKDEENAETKEEKQEKENYKWRSTSKCLILMSKCLILMSKCLSRENTKTSMKTYSKLQGKDLNFIVN